MPSLIPGFEYDVFISYRQKDNKHDGWVTEFVDQLKGELESTFKEEISVYFDINPHDGLLETHDVDESLKEKLKCLVFIPIISRTYCDPKSFAWEHEFKAFVKLASADQFGLKIKLPNGNVASRVLPVQIHDLENEDQKLCESVLEGVLRGIEFIYKEPGIDKPLASDDDEKKNLNKTKYRIQIVKVAHAIKDIISALQHCNPLKEEVSQEAAKPIPVPRKNKKTIIITSVVAVALIILGVFFIPKLLKPKEQLEKSIAVLPFINDSPSDSNQYFINGLMDEILNNLQKIKECRVLSRTSTEQYRGTNRPTIPEIAKKLEVNYIVEGSGQKYGNTFKLQVQLIAANNEKHIWGDSYEQEIRNTNDIFKVQSQIAQSIAEALKASITPEEKKIIEKKMTVSLTAYDFYQRGVEEISKFSFLRAEEFFKQALVADSTFALAYFGLAQVYWVKNFYKTYYSKDFLDTVLILANRALSYDDHLPEGYYCRAVYYSYKGNIQQAEKEFDKALKYNPNYWQAYRDAVDFIYISSGKNTDYVKALKYLHKAVSLNRGKQLPDLLVNLGTAYGFVAGFPEEAKKYYSEAFKLHRDTNRYYRSLSYVERALRNYEKSIELIKKSYAGDSANVETLAWLAFDYSLLNRPNESFIYAKKLENRVKELDWFYYSGMKWIGYAYWQKGYKNEANYWFNEQIKVSEESLKLGRYYSIDARYDLAGVYAFLGDKRNSYRNLKELVKMNACPLWQLSTIKDDPLFNSIREEPEFQKIITELESKYHAEHEKVRKWLEENNMLYECRKR